MGPALAHVDTSELRKLEKDLSTYASRALPYAVRETLNRQAFESQRDWRRLAGKTMILRNGWTTRSIQVAKAKSLDLRSMQAIVGSAADYMATQEEGEMQGKKGRHGVPIPAAAPGARKQRKRNPSGPNKLKTIKLLPRVSGHRSRKVSAAFEMAKRRGGSQYAYLELGKGKRGIYRLSYRATGRSSLKKVWDLSKSRVTIKANPTMQRATAQVVPLSDGYYREAMLTQLRRHRILGY